MMLATDVYALIGIDLAACAVFLRATSLLGSVSTSASTSTSTSTSTAACAAPKAAAWAIWLTGILLVGLWLPYGDADLPLLAYARGIVSDLSVTSVLLAVLYIARRMGFSPAGLDHEKRALYIVLAFTALVLYPTALGWGDWDAYRSGWGSAGLVIGLSLLALSCFWKGLRLLPLLVAAALTAWSLGVLESGNLWDYLIDPWIACVSLGVAVKLGLGFFRRPVL